MFSVIVPIYNEEKAVLETLNDLKRTLDTIGSPYEIIAVNDGSKDNSAVALQNFLCDTFSIITHVGNLGYGRSLMDGILKAKYEGIVIIDGDGSYPSGRISDLLVHYPEYDMVVGARTGKEYRRGVLKRPARLMFCLLVKYVVGKNIPDVNSGLRIFKKSVVLMFMDSLCAGFSFTTTITLLFCLNQYYVKYVPIEYHPRVGESKVNHFRDTFRAGQIIIEAILHYNPMKLFLLLAFLNSAFGCILAALNYYTINSSFLTLLSSLCIASFVPVFCLGCLATQLKKLYANKKVQ